MKSVFSLKYQESITLALSATTQMSRILAIIIVATSNLALKD